MPSNQYKTPLATLSVLLEPNRRGLLPSKVMVLAPSVQALISLRRELAITGRTALVNVEFGTLPTFVNDLVKAKDPDFWRLRISDRELYSLVRVILREIASESPRWSDLADQEELATRLAASIADRAWAPPVRIDPARARSASDLVEVAYHKISERLGGRWTFDGQLFQRAEALVDDEAFCRYLRSSYPTIILYMPHGLIVPAVRFASRLLSKVDGCVIYGNSGSREIDSAFDELIPRSYFDERNVAVVDCAARPLNLNVVDLPDARSEVSYVVQRVVEALDRGVDISDISVTFSDRSRYLDILRSAFSEIGITTSLTDDRKSTTAIFASLIRRITQLDANSVFSEVISLLADLKVGGARCGEVLASASNPVLIGSPKAFGAHYEQVPPSLRFLSSVMNKVFTLADNFRGIVSNRSPGADSWSSAGKRLHFLLKDFASSNKDTFLSLSDLSDGIDGFCELLLRLGEADGYISNELPSSTSIWSLLNSMVEEVEETVVGANQLLRVQSVTSAPCLTSRLGFFLGLTDDVFPPRPPRSLLDGQIRERLGLLSEKKSEALSNRGLALSVALCNEVTVTIPRVDVVGEKTLHVAGVVTAIEGLFANSGSIARLRFDSTLSMVAADPLPPMEEVMVRLLTAKSTEMPSSIVPRPIFSSTVDLRNSTQDDAQLSRILDLPSLLRNKDGLTIAPTSVEEWIRCPYEYFVRRVLKADQFRNFDEVGMKDPLTRGSYSHKVIESVLHREVTVLGSPSDESGLDYAGYVDYPWHTPRLRFQRAIEAKRVAREAKWSTWFLGEFMDETGVDLGSDSIEFEVELPTIEYDVGDGTKVNLRGRVDMLVRRNDESAKVVAIVDFKTGSASYYGGTGSGRLTSVQLVLYGEMASTEGDEALLEYWFFDEQRNLERKTVDIDWREAAKVSSRRALGAILGGSFSRYHHLDDEGRACKFCYPFDRRDNIAGVEVSEIEALARAYELGLSRDDR